MKTADRLQTLLNTKEAIKQVLIDKGQTPTEDFSSYAQQIADLPYGVVQAQNLTQSEYDALGDKVNSDNILYIIE